MKFLFASPRTTINELVSVLLSLIIMYNDITAVMYLFDVQYKLTFYPIVDINCDSLFLWFTTSIYSTLNLF